MYGKSSDYGVYGGYNGDGRSNGGIPRVNIHNNQDIYTSNDEDSSVVSPRGRKVKYPGPMGYTTVGNTGNIYGNGRVAEPPVDYDSEPQYRAGSYQRESSAGYISNEDHTVSEYTMEAERIPRSGYLSPSEFR